jgi:hypothetical protein
MFTDHLLLHETSGFYRQLLDRLVHICMPVVFYVVYVKKKAVAFEMLCFVCVVKC